MAGCRKGNRECSYPELPGSKGKFDRSAIKSKDDSCTIQYISPTSSNEVEEDDIEQDAKLETIPDEIEPDGLLRRESMAGLPQVRRASAVSLNIASGSGRQASETPSQDQNESVSPTNSNSTVATGSSALAGHLTLEGTTEYMKLPPDFQNYLQFFKKNMTNYHYGLAVDEDDFFKSELQMVAVTFEPLLNALVGFAAYHVTLQNPNGKLNDFLQYYNRSVVLLLRLLRREQTHNVHVLLTILQLATIEVCYEYWRQIPRSS